MDLSRRWFLIGGSAAVAAAAVGLPAVEALPFHREWPLRFISDIGFKTADPCMLRIFVDDHILIGTHLLPGREWLHHIPFVMRESNILRFEAENIRWHHQKEPARFEAIVIGQGRQSEEAARGEMFCERYVWNQQRPTQRLLRSA